MNLLFGGGIYRKSPKVHGFSFRQIEIRLWLLANVISIGQTQDSRTIFSFFANNFLVFLFGLTHFRPGPNMYKWNPLPHPSSPSSEFAPWHWVTNPLEQKRLKWWHDISIWKRKNTELNALKLLPFHDLLTLIYVFLLSSLRINHLLLH